MPVKNAQEATAIVREYTERAFLHSYWREVVESEFNSGNNEWRVVFVASPRLTVPYNEYEAIVDADTGNIIRFKKLEGKA